MKHLVASLDCGTTTIKAGITDLKGNVVAFSQKPCGTVYKKDGGVEQDADGIVKTAFSCLKEAVSARRLNVRRISAVSVTNQRASLICTDKKGAAIGKVLSWQDMRGAKQVEKLRSRIDDKSYYKITGIPNNPVFSLAKALWIKKNSPSVYKRCYTFSLVGDYVAKKLGAAESCTDLSNASLTGMLDISKLDWSQEILGAAGVDRNKLGSLVPSGRVIGEVSAQASRSCGLLKGTPVVSGGGDQQCAGIGAGCVRQGVAEYTLGTAGVLLTCSDRVVRDPAMRVTCCVHAVPGKWEVEGLQNSAAVCLDWISQMIDNKGRFRKRFLKKVSGVKPGAGGIIFYPYLNGASAPHWNPSARAILMGMTRGHSDEQMVRAVMEGVAFQAREILEVFSSLRLGVEQIRLTGGGSGIDTWNRIQADIFRKRLYTLKNPQATLLGTAVLAAFGVGLFRSVKSASDKMVGTDRSYIPHMRQSDDYERIYASFRDVYRVFEDNGVFEIAGWGKGART